MDSTSVEAVVSSLPNHPKGTVILINAETGEYIAAETEDEARDAFEERFGWGVPAAVHVVSH